MKNQALQVFSRVCWTSVLSLFSYISFAQSFTINGTVKGMKKGELYIWRNDTETTEKIKVRNYAFQYGGSIDGPTAIGLSKEKHYSSDEERVTLFIEPTTMTLSLDLNEIPKAELKGSKSEEEYRELKARIELIDQKYTDEIKLVDEAYEKYQEAKRHKKSEQVLQKLEEEKFAARDGLSGYFEERTKANIDFIRKYPDSYVSAYLTRFVIGGMSYQESKSLFDSLSKELREHDITKEVRVQIADKKSGSPGSLASDFETKDVNGKDLRLSDFRGKYVMIDFWASWCLPCRKAFPHVKELYEKYRDQGFEVIAVADNDRTLDKWRQAIEKDGIQAFHNVLRGLKWNDSTPVREGDISAAYGISYLPTKILIDPNGLIIGRYGTPGEDDEALDKKLKEIFEKEKN